MTLNEFLAHLIMLGFKSQLSYISKLSPRSETIVYSNSDMQIRIYNPGDIKVHAWEEDKNNKYILVKYDMYPDDNYQKTLKFIT